jgi:hemin uptake protein HemP
MTDLDPDQVTAQQPKVCQHRNDPCAMCRGIAGMRVVHSDELLQGDREVFIIHAGQVYRLLRTRNDKLILQK